MKKLSVILIAVFLGFSVWGCSSEGKTVSDIPSLDEVTNYTQTALEDKLKGKTQQSIYTEWGEPDGSLFGLYGDIWELKGSGEKDQIIIYYNSDGIIEEIKLVSD